MQNWQIGIKYKDQQLRKKSKNKKEKKKTEAERTPTHLEQCSEVGGGGVVVLVHVLHVVTLEAAPADAAEGLEAAGLRVQNLQQQPDAVTRNLFLLVTNYRSSSSYH